MAKSQNNASGRSTTGFSKKTTRYRSFKDCSWLGRVLYVHIKYRWKSSQKIKKEKKNEKYTGQVWLTSMKINTHTSFLALLFLFVVRFHVLILVLPGWLHNLGLVVHIITLNTKGNIAHKTGRAHLHCMNCIAGQPPHLYDHVIQRSLVSHFGILPKFQFHPIDILLTFVQSVLEFLAGFLQFPQTNQDWENLKYVIL